MEKGIGHLFEGVFYMSIAALISYTSLQEVRVNLAFLMLGMALAEFIRFVIALGVRMSKQLLKKGEQQDEA
jgi:hypothetical protein